MLCGIVSAWMSVGVTRVTCGSPPNNCSLRLLLLSGSQPNETGDDAISAYRSAFRKALERDGRMCLCGVLGAEAGVLTPEVVEQIQSFFRRCIDDLTQRIGGPEAEARAFHVMATLEGGMMLARAYRDIGAFDQAVASLT